MTKRKDAAERRNLDWLGSILPVALAIVESYDIAVTVRQLFYRLVSLPKGHPGRIPNTEVTYNTLTRRTAEARRQGRFPMLIDERRSILRPPSWSSPREGIEALRQQYQRDRTEGQQQQIWLGTEKAGMVALMESWFADYGLPIIALSGQCSQGYIDAITAAVERDGRPPVLLYVGDHDPSGWRILHSFIERTDYWVNPDLPQWDSRDLEPVIGYTKPKNPRSKAFPIPNYNLLRKYRVALQPEQCDGLARNPAKEKDPSLQAFRANFDHTLTDDEVEDGLGVQIEADALEPTVLRDMFLDALGRFWDDDAHRAVLDAERVDLERLDGILDGLDQTA